MKSWRLKLSYVGLVFSFLFLLGKYCDARRVAQLPKIQEYFLPEAPVVQYVALVNLGKFLGGLTQIPDEVIQGVEKVLAEAREDEVVKGFLVKPVGRDLMIHLSGWQKGSASPEIYDLIRGAVIQGLNVAKQEGYLNKPQILSMNSLKQLEELQLRCAELPETPRKAEPNAVFVAEGGALGAWDFPLYMIFCNPQTTAGLAIDPRIAPNGFIFDIVDLHNYITINGKTYYETYSLSTKTQQNEILALISDPTRFVIKNVRPAPGSKLSSEEPIATVTLGYFGNPATVQGSYNPAVIFRAQSGTPAAGEYLMLFRNISLLPAGSLRDGVTPYYRPAYPVDIKELKTGSSGNVVRIAGYGFQLGPEGLIPDTIIYPTKSPAMESQRETAIDWVELLERMRGFIPDVTPEYAKARARAVYQSLQKRFQKVPVTEPKGAGQYTISWIKADVGSAWGHIGVPEGLKDAVASVLEAARVGGKFQLREFIKGGREFVSPILEEAQKEGILTYAVIGSEKIGDKDLPVYEVKYTEPLIKDYKVFRIGDDTETLIFHDKGTDSFIQQYVAMLAFLKGSEYAIDHSLYGAGQDILDTGTSGNVRGAGPGVAEMSLSSNEALIALGMDKTSPMAYNLLGKEMLERVMQRDPDKDFIVELWWLDRREVDGKETAVTERIFVDARREWDLLLRLLPNYDNVAVKRIYEKNGEGWDPLNPQQYFGNLVAVFSTDKLGYIAGEYVGKDDPVALFVQSFAELGGLRDSMNRPWVVEGGMRGSHRMVLMPSDYSVAEPTINDAPPIAVALQISFDIQDSEITGFQGEREEFSDDLFKGSEWEKIRRRVSYWNRLFFEHGPFAPYRLTGEAAEYTTLSEVLKLLHRDPTARYESLLPEIVEDNYRSGHP